MKKYKGLESVTIKYKVPDKAEIMEHIYQKIQQHKQKWFGTEPLAVLLGPNEYIAFVDFNMSSGFNGSSSYAGSPSFGSRVFGLPIIVKTANGIDLQVDSAAALDFAMGEIYKTEY